MAAKKEKLRDRPPGTWNRGYPPDDKAENWEVYFSPGGWVWHRPIAKPSDDRSEDQ